MKHLSMILMAGAGLACWQAQAAPVPVSSAIAAAIASPRPKADTDRDAARKPGELLAFAGIKPGDKIGDLMPGTGYFTRLFSRVAGSSGHVYALVPAELAAKAPKIADAMKAIAADPAYSNVSLLIAPTVQTGAPEKLDVVWTSQNYHDVYGFFGADAAAKMDQAIFRALKPGGVFIVIDHVAKAGAGAGSTTTQHRIDPALIQAQVLAAGFTLQATSDILRNPADTHDLKVFAPAIRGHTDQAIFEFRKPNA
jgi:predicted methyltransferase